MGAFLSFVIFFQSSILSQNSMNIFIALATLSSSYSLSNPLLQFLWLILLSWILLSPMFVLVPRTRVLCFPFVFDFSVFF